NNCIETVVGIFATLEAGATFVVVNHTTKEEKLAYIVNNCRATALLLDAKNAMRPSSAALLSRVSSLKFFVVCGDAADDFCSGRNQWLSFNALQRSFPADAPPRVNMDLDLACLIYTSGSTGDPKGVMSDHSNMVFAAGSITEYLQNVESDIVINVLPLSF